MASYRTLACSSAIHAPPYLYVSLFLSDKPESDDEKLLTEFYTQLKGAERAKGYLYIPRFYAKVSEHHECTTSYLMMILRTKLSPSKTRISPLHNGTNGWFVNKSKMWFMEGLVYR